MGDTFSHALRRANDPPLFFVPDDSVLVNGHTPQHMTWREWCSVGWSAPPGFRVMAFVRHPVDRVMSAYRYVHLARPDLVHLAETPSAFMDHFFSPDPAVRLRFDHHNLGMLDFLRNEAGEADGAIELWHISEMDKALATLGLPAIVPLHPLLPGAMRGDGAVGLKKRFPISPPPGLGRGKTSMKTRTY